VEANVPVLQAAIDYLNSHIAMEILSRSKCGDRITARKFGSTGFGTRVFLEEAAGALSPEELEQLNNWLLSEQYRRILSSTTHGIYETIGVRPTDRSRCADAVDRYGSSFTRSKDGFRRLRQTRLESDASQGAEDGSGSQDKSEYEENSN
jgi:hypothetical protein